MTPNRHGGSGWGHNYREFCQYTDLITLVVRYIAREGRCVEQGSHHIASTNCRRSDRIFTCASISYQDVSCLLRLMGMEHGRHESDTVSTVSVSAPEGSPCSLAVIAHSTYPADYGCHVPVVLRSRIRHRQFDGSITTRIGYTPVCSDFTADIADRSSRMKLWAISQQFF